MIRPPGRRGRPDRHAAVVLLVAASLLVAAVAGSGAGTELVAGRGLAGADETTTPGDPSTSAATTSTSDDATTTSAPDTSSTDDGGSSTTSTTDGSTATSLGSASSTTLPAGDGSEQDVGSSFGPQAPFNPASKVAVPADIAQAKAQKSQADAALVRAAADQSKAEQAQAGFSVQTRNLSAADRSRFERALAARQVLVEQAVAAYVQGGSASSIALLGSASPSDLSTGMEMLDSVLEQLEVESQRYTADRAGLSAPLRARMDEGTRVSEDLASAQSTVATATQVDQAAAWQLETYQNNSHVWVPGFIFPVEGPTRFVDSFGDARLSGTSEQHWHEGCDVMAPTGTPLVAVEDGVLTSYGGSDPLGGLSLFLKGTSGYSYYYAHLSAFAPGLAQGDTVTAGQLIGFVGSTGDALAPHVHFEVHDPDGQVLDAYGLLKTAWSARQAQLGLPPGDPATPPTDVDPGTPGGFPRAPDAGPVAVGPPISPYPSV